jgi:hypothetical protein
MIHKLLESLHSVFSRDPEPALVATIAHDSGHLSWSVAEGKLSLTPDAEPESAVEYDLADWTLGALLSEIESLDGYSCPYRDNGEISLLSALVLIDGAKHTASGNGDHLLAYTSVLWSYLHAVGQELSAASRARADLLRQLVMTESSADFADLWGLYHGVPRTFAEEDAAYTQRILREVTRPKSNALAIEEAAEGAAGMPVRILEAWRRIFHLDRSVLDGADYLQDTWRWNWAVIHSETAADREVVRRVIESAKAAGVFAWYHQIVGLGVVGSEEPPGGAEANLALALCMLEQEADQRTFLDRLPPLDGYMDVRRNFAILLQMSVARGLGMAGYPTSHAWLYELDGARHLVTSLFSDRGTLYELHAPGEGEIEHEIAANSAWSVHVLVAAGYPAATLRLSLTPVEVSKNEEFPLVVTIE